MNLFEKIKEYEQVERSRVEQDTRRLKFHLMPPVGWLNDPNGLCQFHGVYHVFFQYSPFDAKGGMKAWGHYTSKDLLHWNYDGVSLVPDEPFDKDGVYSGSALVDGEIMHLFYTGNVQHVGEYDYVYEGREGNTIAVSSTDGQKFTKKEWLLTNTDYPVHYSCHIRDPKLWKNGDTFYMVLGGRTREDVGTILLYQSRNLHTWTFLKEITTAKPFGYMWECPDYLMIDGKEFLSCCPQGVESQEFHYQNIYQSGYFTVEGSFIGDCQMTNFVEWDMGFDFYAPQTFTDESGRTLLIGWAGIPDAPYVNPTVEAGWQHALTVPRVITRQGNKLYQNPVAELEQLRADNHVIEAEREAFFVNDNVELLISEIQSDTLHVTIAKDVHLDFANGIFALNFTNDCGAGRTSRKVNMDHLQDIRVLIDTSLLEIYLNGGEYVLTTRYYKTVKESSILIRGEAGNMNVWELNAMQVIYHE